MVASPPLVGYSGGHSVERGRQGVEAVNGVRHARKGLDVVVPPDHDKMVKLSKAGVAQGVPLCALYVEPGKPFGEKLQDDLFDRKPEIDSYI